MASSVRTARALGLTRSPPFESVARSDRGRGQQDVSGDTARDTKRHLPIVLESLVANQLTDRGMVLMALATIRAGKPGLQANQRIQSRFKRRLTVRRLHSTTTVKISATWDRRTARFKGGGSFSSRARNYDRHGRLLGLGDGLLTAPDLANDAEIAARLLRGF